MRGGVTVFSGMQGISMSIDQILLRSLLPGLSSHARRFACRRSCLMATVKLLLPVQGMLKEGKVSPREVCDARLKETKLCFCGLCAGG